MRRCNQEKCGLKIGGDYEELCPVCAECSAEQHMIDEDCPNCWNCLKDEGYIRDGVVPLPLSAKQGTKRKVEVKNLG